MQEKLEKPNTVYLGYFLKMRTSEINRTTEICRSLEPGVFSIYCNFQTLLEEALTGDALYYESSPQGNLEIRIIYLLTACLFIKLSR